MGDAGDHVVGALGAQPLAALVEKQRRAVFRSRPVAALLEPVGQGLAQLGVEWYLPDWLPLAVDAQDALARGQPHVVDVERDGLGEPRGGVERDQHERLVPRRPTPLHGPEVADLGLVVERAWRRIRDLGALTLGSLAQGVGFVRCRGSLRPDRRGVGVCVFGASARGCTSRRCFRRRRLFPTTRALPAGHCPGAAPRGLYIAPMFPASAALSNHTRPACGSLSWSSAPRSAVRFWFPCDVEVRRQAAGRPRSPTSERARRRRQDGRGTNSPPGRLCRLA